MKISTASSVVLMVVLSAATTNEVSADAGEQAVRGAVERALPYLADEGDIWIEERKCASCHHTGLLIWGHRLAASRGINFEAKHLEGWTQWMLEQELTPRKDDDGKPQGGLNGGTNLEGVSQLVLGGGLAAAIDRGDVNSVAGYQTLHGLIVAGQQPIGVWKAGGQLPSQKRPAVETNVVSTAWAVLALNALPGGDATARRQALSWLASPEPAIAEGKSTEWSAVRVLLADRFKMPADRASAVADLLRRQNDDGGWAWLAGDPSDALATGQALFALAEVGVANHQPAAIAKAWEFLTSTQRDDGSWRTLSTKEKSKAKSTEISNFFGSAWAVIGLCRSLPEQPVE